MNWETVTDQLKAPLDPAAIKPPPQGKFGEYVDGLHVIREANRIFGFNGWSYTVERLELVCRIETQSGQIRIGYLCSVKVVVDGVCREGTAVGNGAGKPGNEADIHESAVKEAETDALKRALRTFGNTFGLALYDKDKSNREVAKPAPDPEQEAREQAEAAARAKQQADQFKNGILRDMNGVRTIEAITNIENHPKFKADMVKLRAMSGDAALEVEERLGEIKAEFTPRDQSQRNENQYAGSVQ